MGRRQGRRRWFSRAAKGGRVGKAYNGQSHLDPWRMGRGLGRRIPDDAAAAPSTATRQPPPAPPIKYLEAGARLFNSAQTLLKSNWPPSIWRPPIVIVISSGPTSRHAR